MVTIRKTKRTKAEEEKLRKTGITTIGKPVTRKATSSELELSKKIKEGTATQLDYSKAGAVMPISAGGTGRYIAPEMLKPDITEKPEAPITTIGKPLTKELKLKIGELTPEEEREFITPEIPPEQMPSIKPATAKEGKKYYVGNVEVSKEEYLIARRRLGFRGGITGGPLDIFAQEISPRLQQALNNFKRGIVQKASDFLDTWETSTLEETLTEIPPEKLVPTLEEGRVSVDEITKDKEKRTLLDSLLKTEAGKFRTDIAGQFEEATGERVVMGEAPIGLGGVSVTPAKVITHANKGRIVGIIAKHGANALKYAGKWIGVGVLGTIGGLGVSAYIQAPEKRMQDVSIELSEIEKWERTDKRGIALGGEASIEYLETTDNYLKLIDAYEVQVNMEMARSPTQRIPWLGYGKGGETLLKAEGLRKRIDYGRQLASRMIVGGTLTDEEITFIMQDMVATI